MSDPTAGAEQESDESAIEKITKDYIAKIMEHCESARVFVTHKTDTGLSGAYTTGAGNFYAQLGEVQEWVIRQDQITRDNQTRSTDE